MKVFVIDPHELEITEQEYDGSLDCMYKLTHCNCVDLVRINEFGDGIFVDDEGLLGNLSEQAFFFYNGYYSPLAGYGMVAGCDEEGETVSPHITLDELKANVNFVTLEQVQKEMSK